MTEWLSDTADVTIIALENARTGGTEVVQGQPVFHADLYMGMRSKREIQKYFDALETYLPAANTLRMPINGKSLQAGVKGADLVAAALSEAAARGYQIILVYTDPIFHGEGRKPFDASYYDNNISAISGEAIALDGKDARDVLQWGAASPQFDPLDHLAEGWGVVLAWLEQHPEVKAQVYGYELVNEPGRVFTKWNDPAQMQVYATGMLMVHQRYRGLWTSDLDGDGRFEPAKILVDIAGTGSGRVGALSEVTRRAPQTPLALLRAGMGRELVWSIHTFTEMSQSEFADPQSYTQINLLAADNILVTETQFDGDFQLLGNDSAEAKALALRYGGISPEVAAQSGPMRLDDFYDASGQLRLAAWMGWELLDPIMGSRNYFGAREKSWYGAHGIGSGFWTPAGFDSSILVGYAGAEIEIHRDIMAFANAMWVAGLKQPSPAMQNLPKAQDCPAPATRCIAAAVPEILWRPQLPPMLGFGGPGADVILGLDTPASEGGVKDFRQGGKQQIAGAIERAAKQRSNGDMVYGLAGDDHLMLRGGDDFGFGGAGDDRLEGGSGHDVLLGEQGDDQIWGGSGDDVLEGGAGKDRLFGGAGRDLLVGGAGDDLMQGGAGADVFYLDAAGDGIDTIAGFEWGKDRLFVGDDQRFFQAKPAKRREVLEVDTSQPMETYRYGAAGMVHFVAADAAEEDPG